MPVPILMPALSPTMEEGTLAKWHVAIGDEIASGDIIAEIETDKATMEVESIEDGKVGKLLVAEGTQGVAVNSTIAMLLQEGEDEGDLANVEASQPEPVAKAPKEEKQATPVKAERVEKVAPPKSVTETPAAPVAKAPVVNGARIIASPLAKRIAAQNNLDLSAVQGSGPNGRIVKADIEAAMKTGTAVQASEAPALTPAVGASDVVTGGQVIQPVSDKEIFATYEQGSYDLVPIDNMRRTVAERLTVSKSTIPHFYMSVDCELDKLLQARKRLNDNAPQEGPAAFKLSVNDFVIKALALALQYVPGANVTWSTQGILQHKRSDISVAVAVDGGLFTPVIRHADLKTLSEISNEMKDLALRARTKKLSPADYVGGTTSISNLGMMGIKKFDAVINPPQASILAVGAGEKRPVIIDDQVSVRTMMSVTLSCDHRAVDGALGAELLNAFKGFIEDPVTMLV